LSKLFENPALLVGLVRAAMIFAVSLGVGITQPQQDSLLELVGAFLAVASLVLTGVTLSKTTPTANPTLPVGTAVTTPTGQSAVVSGPLA
jgi:uncharacterized membrane protein